ncbi:MAG: hypothetical protein IJC78_05900 [Clostridia bacterium]|nr:hypothetical protein [Clostridia bacterium]
MEENKIPVQEEETVEYEDVKHLPLGAFIGIGLAFGVAGGFSAGNLIFGNFALGMAVFGVVGLLGGLILGLINGKKH